jgi:hypothetical protein
MMKNGAAAHRSDGQDETVRITNFIPMRFVRRKFSKIIMRPEGSAAASPGSANNRTDPTLIKALARALYWQSLLDEGRVESVAALAAAEGSDKVRTQKTLKLARLAPDIGEAIARGQTPPGLSLEFFIRKELPHDWTAQRALIAALSR